MAGLLLKDLLNLKKQGKLYLFLLVFYVILGVNAESSSMFGCIILMFSAMIPITAFAFDEKAKWDKYALTMPVSRKDLVLSKYILGFLFTAVGTILYLLFTLFIEKGSFSRLSLLMIGATIAAAILFLSIILPILFKVGTEKGRIYMMMIFFIPAAVGIIISKAGIKVSEPSEFFLESLAYLIPIATVIIAVISVNISIAIYNKKEL